MAKKLNASANSLNPLVNRPSFSKRLVLADF
jgi:hypothetical protein